jgi:UrcA family protein
MLTSKLASFTGVVGAAMLALTIGSSASTAFAAQPDGQVSIKVSTADLNLASDAGARAALVRIRHAAKEICGGGDAEPSLVQQMQFYSCVNSSVERTVAAINLPTLTAVSEGHHVTAMASAH